jgi:CDP-diacylglycerol---glycerol-3-phosphate 3-phosphatidyltransferase
MSRIVLAPLVVVAIYEWAPAWWVLVFGFVSMITDRIDGILARRYGTSKLGIFLDPLADKIIVLGSLFALVARHWAWWLPVAIITAREIGMSWFRSYYARRGVSVPARQLAKIKTWVQSVAVAFALVPGFESHHHWLPDVALWVATFLTVITFAQYVFDGRPSDATT